MKNFKKNMLLVLILGILGIYATSCNKSEILEKPTVTDGYHLNQIPLSDLIVNDEDKDDERVMNAVTLIAKALKPIVQKPVYAEYILKEAQKTSYNSVLLVDFIADFPELSDIINTQLRELSDDQRNTLSLEDLSNQLVYKDIRYNPVIHVPNIQFADNTKVPVLSPGVEVPDNKAENIDDHYFFWLFDENGREYEITIGEAQANSEGAAPAFVVSLLDATDTASMLEGDSEVPSLAVEVSEATRTATSLSLRDDFSIATNEYRLDQRYENSGDLEFYWSARIFGYNHGNEIIFNLGELYIAKVDRNDVGEELSGWKTWFECRDYYESAVFNTYERDWINSKKRLGTLIFDSGHEEDFHGRRRYTSDCYWQTDVSNNTNLEHPLDIDFFESNPLGYWADEYEGDEGDITFWRVQ